MLWHCVPLVVKSLPGKYRKLVSEINLMINLPVWKPFISNPFPKCTEGHRQKKKAVMFVNEGRKKYAIMRADFQCALI